MSPLDRHPTISAKEHRSAWRTTVMRTVLPGLLTITLFVIAIFALLLPALRDSLMDSRRQSARELANTAYALLETYADQVPDQLSLEDAQEQAIRQLRRLRYGPEGKDYFWINDMQPVMIMHPYHTELEGQNISDFTDPDGKRLFQEMVDLVEAQGEGFVEYQWWWKDADRIEPKESFVKGFEPWGWIIGTGLYVQDVKAEIAQVRRHLVLASLLILLAASALIALMIWQARVTERRRLWAEASLRESERKFRGIFHGAAQLIGLLDPRGVLREINDTALKQIGVSAEDVLGKPLVQAPWFTQHPQAQERLHQALEMCRRGERGHFEFEMFDAAHERTLMDVSTKPLLCADGRLLNIVIEGWDITEISALQEQLRQSQKMEAIGKLAGGVAHDFNNILMGILGHAELLLEEATPGSSQAEALRLIINAATRAGDLTQQLLSFSRKGKMQTRPVDLHDIVREVVSLLEHSIDRGIEIEMKLDAPQHMVDGDPSLLQNAILNLGVNARDALDPSRIEPGSPRQLTFATRVVEAEIEDESDECPGLELTVQDTGCGIDPQLHPLVFEPFFTTKAPGEGTGLGLAGVRGCVQSHGGSIDLESEPGHGTVFRILLPLGRTDAPQVTPAAGQRRTGTGHILLVDDEEILRNFARVALTRLGYQVTVCADGVEAVDYFEAHHETVDLVILDLIMNRMGGEEAFRRMRAIDPGVRVLISSGFSRENVVSELEAEGALGFLGKPYKLNEMSRVVASVIGVPEPQTD